MGSLHTIGIAALIVIAPELDGFRALGGEDAAQLAVSKDTVLWAERVLDNGNLHERYQQYHSNPTLGEVPVRGAQLSLQRSPDGTVVSLVGSHYAGLMPSNQVRLSAKEVAEVLVKEHGADGPLASNNLLLDPNSGQFFYRIEQFWGGSIWLFDLDAEDGSLIEAYENVPRGSGWGVSRAYNPPSCPPSWIDLAGLTSYDGGDFVMRAQDDRVRGYDLEHGWFPNCSTFDFDAVVVDNNANDFWDLTGPGGTCDYSSPSHAPIVHGQANGHLADTFYLHQRGFDLVAEYGHAIRIGSHFYNNLNSAAWYYPCGMALFGDGDGTTLLPTTAALEVVVHELGHAVIDKIVTGAGGQHGLEYAHESGALNESFADIMGTAGEWYHEPADADWLIGEDIGLGYPRYIHRYMDDPGRISFDGCASPSHYGDILRSYPAANGNDQGFVHFNSGILNHWFYLLVHGGDNAKAGCRTNAVSGIGESSIQVAADLVFESFADLPTTATLCQARAAIEVHDGAYGTWVASNVEAAFREVGLTDDLCDGPELGFDLPAHSVLSGPTHATVTGWAADVGGLRLDSADQPEVSLWIRPAAGTTFTRLPLTYGLSRPDICSANPAEPTPECDYDFEVACRIDTDPGCPDVGWRSRFDSVAWANGDYILQLRATSYQADSVAELPITIDNSHIQRTLVPVTEDTYIDGYDPYTNTQMCDENGIFLSANSTVTREGRLSFELPVQRGESYQADLRVQATSYPPVGVSVWQVTPAAPWPACPTWNDPTPGTPELVASGVNIGANRITAIPLVGFAAEPGWVDVHLTATNTVQRYIRSSEDTGGTTPAIELRSVLRTVSMPFAAPEPTRNHVNGDHAVVNNGEVVWMPDCDVGGRGAYRFLEPSARLELADDGLDRPAAISLESWVRLDGPIPDAGTRYFSMVRAVGSYNLFIQPWDGNHFVFWVGSDSRGQQASSPDTIRYSTWYHVVGTYDGVTQRIYVDGVLRDQQGFVTGPVHGPTGTALIGDGYPRVLNGALGNVNIYNHALSFAEVAALHASYDNDVSQCPLAPPAPAPIVVR